MGVTAVLIDYHYNGKDGKERVDLRSAATHGGSVEFSCGTNKDFQRIVVKHADLKDVVDFCERTKKLAEELMAMDPKELK